MFLIWIRLEPRKMIYTLCGIIWIEWKLNMDTYECALVVEEVSREGAGRGFEPTDPPLKKIYFVVYFGFFSTRPKTSVLAGARQH
jgi:hypothetical protein